MPQKLLPSRKCLMAEWIVKSWRVFLTQPTKTAMCKDLIIQRPSSNSKKECGNSVVSSAWPIQSYLGALGIVQLLRSTPTREAAHKRENCICQMIACDQMMAYRLFSGLKIVIQQLFLYARALCVRIGPVLQNRPIPKMPIKLW